MSELRDVIRRAQAAKKELIASTVRLAPEEQSFIEEFAEQCSLTRQDAMRHLIKAGIEQAMEEIERLDREASHADTDGDSRFHILNTNKRHSIESHQRMLKDGIAAAFYGDWKFNIDRIRKNDVVFLYENGRGIVAYGTGTGETIKEAYEGNADECHYQVLSGFKVLDKPLEAAEIRKLLERNVVFLRTMSGAPDGQKILDFINSR